MADLKKVHRLAWRRFLTSPAGIEGMLYLRERIPSVGMGDAHNIIFQSGVAEGHRRELDAINEMIGFEESSPTDLDNP